MRFHGINEQFDFYTRGKKFATIKVEQVEPNTGCFTCAFRQTFGGLLSCRLTKETMCGAQQRVDGKDVVYKAVKYY